jgi:hypothetical protein
LNLSEHLRLKNEQNRNTAYKPLLPNDIYKQYFSSKLYKIKINKKLKNIFYANLKKKTAKTKPAYVKDNSTHREKTLILPIISRQPNYSKIDKSFLF